MAGGVTLSIVSRTDIAYAMRKLQQSEEATQSQQSHETVTLAFQRHKPYTKRPSRKLD
jgi:hypothetical protein